MAASPARGTAVNDVPERVARAAPPGPVARVAAWRRRKLAAGDDRWLAFALNTPALVALMAVVGYPIAQTFIYSMYHYKVAEPPATFIGAGNYQHAATDSVALDSLRFTLLFAAISVPLIMLVGICGALILNETFRGRAFVRALVVIPWAIPAVAQGLLFEFIFDGQFGTLNGLLYSLGIIDNYQTWLLDPVTAVMALAFAQVWGLAPLAVIILLAALQAIPSELYEAAKVDRAGIWYRFRHVTLPWLKPSLLIVLVLETITTMRTYDIIYVLTGGGPGTDTSSFAWLAIRTTFSYLDFGLGSTYSFILAAITLVLALVYVRLLQRRGEFEV